MQPSPARPPGPRPALAAGRRAQALVIAGAVVFLGLVWGALVFHLDLRRETEIAQARQDVTNLSAAVSEQVARLVENVDQILRLMQGDYTDDPNAFDFATWAKRATSLDPVTLQLAQFDAGGNLVAARNPARAPPGVNIADREDFRHLAARPDAGLYVNRTVRGRMHDAYAFVLARRLSRPDGGFGGVLTVSIDPAYLTDLFRALDVGAGGSVALFGLDGYLRARLPAAPGMYERDARQGSLAELFADLKPGAGGSRRGVSMFDGRTRLYGFRAANDLPLVVVVGKDLPEVLSSVDEERGRVYLVGFAVSAVILGGGLVLLRELEARRRQAVELLAAHRRLAETETLFRGLFENSPDSLFVHRVGPRGETSLEILNPAAAALSGGVPEGPGVPAPLDLAPVLAAEVGAVLETDRPRERVVDGARPEDGQRYEILTVPLREPGTGRVGRVFTSARDVTHLRRAEARYRLLADSATDMIVQLGLDGRRVYVSPASRSLLGHAPDAMVGTSPLEDAHPEDAPRLAAMMGRLARGEAETGVNTHRLRRADGGHVWVEGSWRLVRDEAHRPAGFVVAVRDVEARHRAEEALRASEFRYRTLAESLPQLVWVTRGPDHTATYVNRQFEAYYGPIGFGRAARVAANHPDDAPRMQAAWETAVTEGHAFEVEGRLRRADGAFRWHKIVMVPARVGADVAGWIGTALDIDDILSARQALAETGDLLRLAQDAAEAGSWEIDLATRTVRLSAEGARLQGLDEAEAAGLPLDAWQERIFADDRAEVAEEARVAIQERRTLSSEFRVRRPNGTWHWLQSIGRAYYDAHGRPERVLGLNIDITERKQGEIALREAKAAADAARLEAERASAAKTDFLASMSHEIRTPLNAVIGFTDLIARADGLAPDLRRQAEAARSAGSALLTVVNDILDFSKVEAGAVELAIKPFHPRALADDCLAIVRGLADAKGLALAGEIDPCLPETLAGDEARLRQILLNLLNNAVKFTHSGRITLSARAEGPAPGGEQLVLRVSDTGIGIPSEKRHRLFERFSQVDSSISRDYGGTGLGLAICRRLVELMGGAIEVESEPGCGSAFTVRLVLPRADAARAPTVAGPRERRTGRILLAEDVALNQDLARIVLEIAGHEVEVVDDGAAALRAVAAGGFDLVLMDVQMPGMDGLAATRAIRALPGPEAAVPIVAMTANVLPDEVVAFREAGMDDHVGKPFDRAELYATIDRWLATRSGDPQGTCPLGGGPGAESWEESRGSAPRPARGLSLSIP